MGRPGAGRECRGPRAGLEVYLDPPGETLGEVMGGLIIALTFALGLVYA